jgi:septum formation protein
MVQFVLASASPARQRLLQMAGIEALIRPSSFDESQIQIHDPVELVKTLAECKAQSIATLLKAMRTESTVVLGCDSVLWIKGEIYGKPANANAAIARWQQMRGQMGELYTGHALIDLRLGAEARSRVQHQMTRVYFAQVSDAEITRYVATGEPLQCAGGFALEGRGGLFVEKLEGCHSNVIGLSLPLLRQMLQDLGYSISDFWKL